MSAHVELKTVLNRFSLDGADTIANLQRVAVGLPEPLNQQVNKLADQTSQVLVIAALRELEKRWDSEIYSFYRDRLAGRYPFKASGEDASLEDFEAFFGPQGRLQQFHDQYLNVFLEDNLDALYSDSLGGYLVRSDVLEQLKKVERIRDTFFNHRGHLAVQLTIEPLALSATRLSSMLSVDGQLIPYQHGAPQRTGLAWPNSLGNTNGSQLTLVHSTGNTTSLSYRGPWSLFRLLSRGHLEQLFKGSQATGQGNECVGAFAHAGLAAAHVGCHFMPGQAWVQVPEVVQPTSLPRILCIAVILASVIGSNWSR